MTPLIQNYLNQLFSQRLGLDIDSISFQSKSGGCISENYQVTINHNIRYFLKINSQQKYPGLFEKEKSGLEFIGNQKIIAVPEIILLENFEGQQILLLEWIESGEITKSYWKQFGERMAALHRRSWHGEKGYPLFGFKEDNYMGSLWQTNIPKSGWTEFFISCRLVPQIKLARDKHFLSPRHVETFENLFRSLAEIFNQEDPSLLHGDLWNGNFMCTQDSEPLLIDPAVYFGHRSMDLAMTTLFGGFDMLFYDSYNYHFKLPPNHREQWQICNLYPLLIHLNIFGAGYLSQIEATLRRFTV